MLAIVRQGLAMLHLNPFVSFLVALFHAAPVGSEFKSSA
jgi:hypothetical protein